jgi:hypothetical protein
MDSEPRVSLSSTTTQSDVAELLNSLLSSPHKSLLLLPCENCLGQDEHILALQEALREVVDENEVLRERAVELEALLAGLEDDLQAEDEVIGRLQREFEAKKRERKGE